MLSLTKRIRKFYDFQGNLMIFIVAFLGAITPGPDILLVLQTALKYGVKKAIATLAGIATGWIVYLGILYFGFATLFQSDIAQIILSLFGAIYLCYLGYLLMSKPNNKLDFNAKINDSGYIKGLIVNLSNPKAIIFFAIIVTPFMDKDLLLNLVILLCGLFSAFILVILLALFFRRFLTNRLFNIIDKVCGIVFFAFAILLVVRIFQLI